MNGISHKTRAAGCLALLLAALPLAGCISSQNTRMPSLAYGDPRADRRSYDYHDPLPESQVGPFVERPREAVRQRSEPRRTMEHAITPMSGSLPQSTARYPDVVNP